MFTVLIISDKIVLAPDSMGSDPYVNLYKHLLAKYMFKVNLKLTTALLLDLACTRIAAWSYVCCNTDHSS